MRARTDPRALASVVPSEILSRWAQRCEQPRIECARARASSPPLAQHNHHPDRPAALRRRPPGAPPRHESHLDHAHGRGSRARAAAASAP